MRFTKFFRMFIATFVVLFSVSILSLGIANAQQNPNLPAIVVDANNGEVLYANRADEVRAPASITKVMTLYLVFDAMQSGRINWNTQMPVSKNAASRPRSKLDVPAGSTISLRDAVNSLVVVSANDSAVVVAEYLAGSEEKFAQLMTLKARSLGMSNTTFKNANGLPAAGHVSTARDIALMSLAMREHFPQYYNLFSMRSFTYKGRVIKGHNRVLDRIEGADGLKTGFTNAAGFTIATTVARGGKKIVIVVLGGASGRQRDDMVVFLSNAYFDKASRFSKKQIFAKWNVAQSVWRGQPAKNGTVAQEPVEVTAIDKFPLAPKRVAVKPTAKAIEQPAQEMTASIVPTKRNTSQKANKSSQQRELAPTMAYANNSENNATDALKSQINAVYIVEVAALDNKKTADGFLKDIKASLGAGKTASLGYVDQGKMQSKTVYRVRFGSFHDEASAASACSAIIRQAYSCYVLSN